MDFANEKFLCKKISNNKVYVDYGTPCIQFKAVYRDLTALS